MLVTVKKGEVNPNDKSQQLKLLAFYITRGVVRLVSFKVVRTGTLLFLLVGLLFTSTSALSYWQEVTILEDVEVTTIGSPMEIIITDLNEGNNTLSLVPAGYAIVVGDVEMIELHYDIGVSKELLNQVNLHIDPIDILINDVDTYSHLVKITIMGQEDGAIIDLYNDVLTITIIVELLEPIDLEEANSRGLSLDLVNVEDAIAAYEEINGENISFVLELELQKKEVIN